MYLKQSLSTLSFERKIFTFADKIMRLNYHQLDEKLKTFYINKRNGDRDVPALYKEQLHVKTHVPKIVGKNWE